MDYLKNIFKIFQILYLENVIFFFHLVSSHFILGIKIIQNQTVIPGCACLLLVHIYFKSMATEGSVRFFFNIIYCQIGFHTTPSAHPNKCSSQSPSPTFPSPPPPINPHFALCIWESLNGLPPSLSACNFFSPSPLPWSSCHLQQCGWNWRVLC